MNLLIAQADGTDSTEFTRAARAAGFTCRLWDASAQAEPEAFEGVSVIIADAWISPDRLDGLCEAAGGVPALVVAFDADQSVLGMHAARGAHHLLTMPASPQVVADAVATATERVRLRMYEEDGARRLQAAKIESDVAVAHDIQQGFLPDRLPDIPGYTMAARLRPAREVAGDFYDAFSGVYGRRIGFSVSDVCDKGVGAALFMAIFRTLYRSLARSNSGMRWLPAGTLEGTAGDDPLDSLLGATSRSAVSTGSGALLNAVAGTNDYMLENHGLAGYFATTFFALLDPETGSLQYINAGHNPPVLVRADGRQILLSPSGPAVGIIPKGTFDIREEMLNPGDSLFCFTDGVPEAKDASGRFFTEQRLQDVLRRPAESADELIERMTLALAEHVRDAEQYDDITMLALHRQA